LSSGRPIIVFPPGGTVSPVRRILVAWNATRESVRAVADALPLLVKTKVVEVLVVDHERNRAGHSQEPGADIARHLARHGAHVEVRSLSSGGKDVVGCCFRGPPLSALISLSWCLWPLPPERVDVRWRHADDSVRGGLPVLLSR